MDTGGILKLTDSSEIRFLIDEYEGVKRAHIRKYVDTENYTGPTKSGIRMAKDELRSVSGLLDKLDLEKAVSEEKTLGEYKLDDSKSIKVQIQKFRGSYGVNIRQYVKTDKYTGPTKRGIRIPVKYLQEAKSYIKKLQEELDKETKQ